MRSADPPPFPCVQRAPHTFSACKTVTVHWVQLLVFQRMQPKPFIAPKTAFPAPLPPALSPLTLPLLQPCSRHGSCFPLHPTGHIPGVQSHPAGYRPQGQRGAEPVTHTQTPKAVTPRASPAWPEGKRRSHGAVGLTLSGFSRSRTITLRLTVWSSRSSITWMCFFTCACKIRGVGAMAGHIPAVGYVPAWCGTAWFNSRAGGIGVARWKRSLIQNGSQQGIVLQIWDLGSLCSSALYPSLAKWPPGDNGDS